MTQNALAYLNYLETTRNHKVVERETQRSHLADETERQRANIAREIETNRANTAKEGLTLQANLFQNAHYVRMDQENVRHDVASELETNRHNLVTEMATNQTALNGALGNLNQAVSNLVAARNAETNMYNADTQRLNTEYQYQLGKERNALTSQSIDLEAQRLGAQMDRWATQSLNETRKTNADISLIESNKQLNAAKTEQANKENKWFEFSTLVGASNDTLRAFGSILGGGASVLRVLGG